MDGIDALHATFYLVGKPFLLAPRNGLRLGARLLVDGAHRHPSWIEWLAGHTTGDALRHADMTFLMAH